MTVLLTLAAVAVLFWLLGLRVSGRRAWEKALAEREERVWLLVAQCRACDHRLIAILTNQRDAARADAQAYQDRWERLIETLQRRASDEQVQNLLDHIDEVSDETDRVSIYPIFDDGRAS